MNSFSYRGLYAIVDDQVHASYGHFNLLRDIVENSSIQVIQLRLKKIPSSNKIDLIEKALKLKSIRPFCLIINDDIEFLSIAGVDGLHLGQSDVAFPLARKLHPSKILGLSTHNAIQVKQAAESQADYIGCGSVFNTTTKNASHLIGLDGLREMIKASSTPETAIGGITEKNIVSIAQCGPQMAAVISGLINNGKFIGQRLHELFLENQISR